MITVISGTNRFSSESLLFAQQFVLFLEKHGSQPVKLLSMEAMSHDWFHSEMYEKEGQRPSLQALQNAYIIPADKFLIVAPEYNGSFPGVLKLFLDACSVREYNASFKDKKAALVGVATGRAGNLRGMDHLTGILHHLGTIVMPEALPISRIGGLVDEGEILDDTTLSVMEQYAINLINF